MNLSNFTPFRMIQSITCAQMQTFYIISTHSCHIFLGQSSGLTPVPYKPQTYSLFLTPFHHSTGTMPSSMPNLQEGV